MTDNDFDAFSEKLLGISEVYMTKQLSAEALNVSFDSLIEYPLPLVFAGLQHAVKGSKFMPKPADVIEAIKNLTGQDKDQLESKAHIVFKEISRNINIGCDYVFEDARAASAFKQAFGSIVEYGKKTEEDTWLEKRFVEAYASPYLENTGNILGGLYAYTDDPMVRFVGDYDRCLEIVNNSENYQGKHPRLPEDPRKIIKIEYKGDNSPTISKDEFERGMRQIFETCGIIRG